jgi:hypothetical protein
VRSRAILASSIHLDPVAPNSLAPRPYTHFKHHSLAVQALPRTLRDQKDSERLASSPFFVILCIECYPPSCFYYYPIDGFEPFIVHLVTSWLLGVIQYLTCISVYIRWAVWLQSQRKILMMRVSQISIRRMLVVSLLHIISYSLILSDSLIGFWIGFWIGFSDGFGVWRTELDWNFTKFQSTAILQIQSNPEANERSQWEKSKRLYEVTYSSILLREIWLTLIISILRWHCSHIG